MNKFERIRDLIAERGKRGLRILDIGCRRQELRDYIEHFGLYHGADLCQIGSVEFPGDFTKGLPVKDKDYDVTVALDVIEHTHDMTIALDEMMRVTSLFGIVILPNHAHWSFRLRFLFAGRLSDKWDIDFPLSQDRHRFLTTAKQSTSFVQGYARSRGFRVEQFDSKIGQFGPILEKTLGRLWPNFWNKNQLYVVSR